MYRPLRFNAVFRSLSFVLLSFLVACTGATPVATSVPTSAPETAAPAATDAAGAPRVALIMIGPRDDHSWAAAAYDALQAQESEGIETAFSESVADADVARVMREYADEGYNVIVAHSFSYQDAVFQVASEYPEVNFAWAGGINRTAENVADYDQPFYEPAYLVGILAGHVSESGSLGGLYGFDIPVCHSMGEAMLAGAQTVNPDARLTVTAVGDWGDVALAKEAGLAQVDTAGVDFWIGCGEGPTLGSIEAAKEAGGYTTGYVGDMSVVAPDVVLSSIVWNMDPIFDSLVTQTEAGELSQPWLQYGVEDGALDIVINPELSDQVPAEALQAIDEARAAIEAGTLVVPFVPE